MTVVVVILGAIAVAAIVVALVVHRRLRTQRQLAATAGALVAERAKELAAINEALESSTRDQAAANVRADEAVEAQRHADERTAVAEQLVAELNASFEAATMVESDRQPGEALDPQVLWMLERARSERTWRHSVALGPDSESVFTDAADPLREALQVELDAAREDVGAVVELEHELPAGVTAAGSVLTLRAAQELLADVVRRAEEMTLVVNADGTDVVVTIRAIDENGQPVVAAPLPIPPSADIAAVSGGVRIRNAIVEATMPD